MLKKSTGAILIIVVSCIFHLGDAPTPDIVILVPGQADSVSYDPGKVFVISVLKDAGANLLFSTQWEKTELFDLREEGMKQNFAGEFYRLMEPKTTSGAWHYSCK